MKRIFMWFAFLALIFGLQACDSLPKEMREKAKAVPERITAMQEEVKKEEKKYSDFAASESFTAYKVYAEREKWSERFGAANADLVHAKDIFDKSVVPILKKNESAETNLLSQELARVNRTIAVAKDKANHPFTRMSFLKDAKEKCSEWLSVADKESASAEELIQALEATIGKTKADFPPKATEINNLYVPIRTKHETIQKNLEGAKQEFAKHRQNDGQFVDYALLGDSTVSISKILKEIQTEDKQLRSKLDELYQSYTKILADMRIEYYIIPARISWQESEAIEWPTETTYNFPPRKVSEEVHKYFVELPPEKEIANDGWFGLSVNIDKNMYAALNLNPEENMPSGDNMYDIWIEDDDIKAYHKYIIIGNDGKKEETDWIEVDEEDFEENADDLGMEIEAKPYGEFESEKREEANPPGMSMVGNPKYGEWKNDPSTGQSFWAWYGQYALISNLLSPNTPYYYSRGEWNDYREHKEKKQPYYGASGGGASTTYRYGSMGSMTNSNGRYANTHFAKTGGFKAADASMRSAGPAGRAGGPGGGGK